MVTLDATGSDGTKSITVASGTTISTTINGMTFTLDFTIWLKNDSILYLRATNPATVNLTASYNGTTHSAFPVTIGDAVSYYLTASSIGLNDRAINLKVTDDAGGAISLGADEITFTPNSDDDILELSVTRNGTTRTASLDVTGSVTYKLDSSITLAKNTVVKNVFEDGNISSIDGTINYNGGIVTASDGAQAHFLVEDIWESELRTSGGTASIQFIADKTVYTLETADNYTFNGLELTTTKDNTQVQLTKN